MDTIETSNLNRQFLFRQRHVGQSKAKVAAEAVKRFRPAANITAYQVLSARSAGQLHRRKWQPCGSLISHGDRICAAVSCWRTLALTVRHL